MKLAYLISAFVGIVVGFLSTRGVLLGSWLDLFLWGAAGVIIGLFVSEKKILARSGLLYGFFVTFSFLMTGFRGASDKFVGFLIFSIFLSAIGALCGWLAVYIGYKIKQAYKK